MIEQTNGAPPATPLEEMQAGWQELNLRVKQLEAQRAALEQENKAIRLVLERAIDHRLKSHSELVMILNSLVSKLPINDVGVIVSRLVEHNTNSSQYLAALLKGAADTPAPQPALLKTLDQTRKELLAALKPVVEELSCLNTAFEAGMLESLLTQPDVFFSPRFIRANRCFVKGQVRRERVVREFGEAALICFTDMTTDPKLNPRPKPEEILLAFKDDLEAILAQNPTLLPDKRQELSALFQKIQRAKAPTEEARAQRNAFHRLSFLLELLHFYEHQDLEAPDAVFAQRLPGLIEQLALPGAQDTLDEKHIALAESLLAHVINPEHRQMTINNVGKGGGVAKTLKFILKLRAEKAPGTEADQTIQDFLRQLLPSPPQRLPSAQSVTALLHLTPHALQGPIVKAIMTADRIRREDSESLGRVVWKELGLPGQPDADKAKIAESPQIERQREWARIKELISSRTDAGVVAAAIRERLNARYEAEELKQSWVTLIEADAITLIKIVCQLPYLPSGKTDPIARPVLETYISRLTHEKYAATYNKIVNSLKAMFHARPDNAVLLNFLALVRWVSPESADRMAAAIGMAHGQAG